ncbi:MAG: ABC-ATPase UvrA [Planctomycetaceae bacterium]|nr:ABC-ATPase UvrA [Planctomycetaceae bacterium]
MLTETATTIDRTDNRSGAIRVYGARVHNLCNIDVEIPHNQFTVITGVSGSGKSSLAFDTLFAEGQRRYLDSLSTYTRQFLNQLERPDVDLIEGLPPTISIDQRSSSASQRSTLATITEIYDYLRLLYARCGLAHCPNCGDAVSQQSAEAIVGHITGLDDRRKVMILSPLVQGRKGQHREMFERICKNGFVRARVDGEIVDASSPPEIAKGKNHDIDVVIDRIVVKEGIESRLRESVDLALKHGNGKCFVSWEQDGEWLDRLYSTKFACAACEVSFPDLEPRTFSFNSPYGACPKCSGLGHLADEKDASIVFESCPECSGARLSPFARSVRVGDVAIHDLTAKTVEESLAFVRSIEATLDSPETADNEALPEEQRLAAKGIIPDIRSRLEYLDRVGVGYLSLNRSAATLSGGEFQRARLASCLGSGLIGVCYVLDEPTIGLHPKDTGRMLSALQGLRDAGNTVIVVEHDCDLMREADYLIDLGPGAGNEGGSIVAYGTIPEIINNPASVTGRYLNNTDREAGSQKRTVDPERTLQIAGANLHNLENVSVQIPLGVMTAVTGVSGSGKTSLISQTLVPVLKTLLSKKADQANEAMRRVSLESLVGHEQLERLIEIDQSAIGRTSRSNAATYSGIWDEVRKAFAKTREARIRGYNARRFSFNSADGRCAHCKGQGDQRIEMRFLPDLYVECPECRGARFNRATLAVRYRSRSVADVLRMRIDEAAQFFESFPKLSRILDTFCDVGLGYLTLGQSALTLSGGEAQRIKLATELSKSNTANTLFVLDEPTTGLHAADVARLIDLLQKLVNQGNSVLVIEHNTDLIAAADWEIELGPEGGTGGGEVISKDL